MKLSNIFPQIKAEKVQVKKTRESTPVDSSPQATTAADKVELSSGSVGVQKMHEIIQQTPDIRAEKVKALKEKIEKGEYLIDSYKVADKLLLSLLEDNIIE